jgi:hypothetical protein
VALYFVAVGAAGGIRTPDPQVRSLMLYPTELRPRGTIIVAQSTPVAAALRLE